jgi:hypothetical protein
MGVFSKKEALVQKQFLMLKDSNFQTTTIFFLSMQKTVTVLQIILWQSFL